MRYTNNPTGTKHRSGHTDWALILDDDSIMVEATLGGVGIAYVYERDARSLLQEGTLTTVLDDWCPSPSRFFLYYPGARQIPIALRAFIDFMKRDL